ncbi:MAG: replicative DNA helicase [Deltaproteobacteria bacterium]|nr:replicative DNA helicase [Deltaproteobacteria bacterium]
MRATPHAPEAERALLGGLILRPDQIAIVAEIVGQEDFWRREHGELFKLLAELSARGATVDAVTVPIRVGSDPDRYGGTAYVAELVDQVPSTANLGHYAEIIRSRSLARQLSTVATALADEASAAPDTVEELVDRAANEILGIGRTRGRGGWAAISELLDTEIVRIQKVYDDRDRGGTGGYTTGFIDLDTQLDGLHPSDLVILAARPGMGKTALALNIGLNLALDAKRPVGVFSFEMGRGQLVTRMLCCHALVDGGKIKTGKLDQEDWERLTSADEFMRATRVYIDDTPNLSIGDVRGRARRLKSEHADLGLIILDYLQLMRGDDPRASREQQISAISRGLKILAKELQVPVLALSQLNRSVESRPDKRPLVSDLRESGAIEQDADVILFIYRDELYNKETAEPGVAEVIIAKHRNGPTGTVRLAFQGQYTRFDNLDDRPLRLT